MRSQRIDFRQVKGKIKLNEPLSRHTTLGIGGEADFFIEPYALADLKILFKIAKDKKIPCLIIGEGSNLLVSDRGVRGMVIKLSSSYFRKITRKGLRLEVGAGVRLARLVNYALKFSLSGLEFLAGIPGSLGGALLMNAGVSKKNQSLSIGDLVGKITVIDRNGKIKILSAKKLRFGYRKSNLSKYAIVSALLKIRRAKEKKIRARIKEYIAYRKATQEWRHPNAGCVFKNPLGFSAGKLIDQCGLKGKRCGGVEVSRRHANFIVNHGRGKAADLLKLIELVKKMVRSKFNIELEPEIIIWK